MNETQWATRGGMIGPVALAAILVVSVALGALAISPITHATPAPLAGKALPDLTSGPLVKVAGSVGPLSTATPTTFGSFTVLPTPTKYNPDAPVSVVVTLNPTGDLKAFVDTLSNPASSQYRHFLTASTLGTEFGVGATTYASVESYFQSFGLSVLPSSTLLSVTVSGTVAQASAAFHTQMAAFEQQYQSDGRWLPEFGPSSAIAGTTLTGPVFYANIAPVQLPAKLSALVGGIAGLDGMQATPNLVMPLGMGPQWYNNSTPPPPPTFACEDFPYGCAAQINAGQNISQANYLWTNCTAVGFSGQCTNYQFLFPSTMHVLTGAGNLWNGLNTISSEPDLGQGITIAVIEVGCAIPSDLEAWSNATFGNANQLMDRLTQIALNQSSALSLIDFNESNNNLNACILNGEFAGWTGETELDIEYAAAMAPNAHIDVIGLGSPDFSAFNDAFAQVAQYLATGMACSLTGSEDIVVEGPTQGACSVTITSNSYGEGEPYEYFFGSPMYITAADTLLEALNAIGVTNFFASGDGGGTDPTGVATFANADSPGATGVGGGQLTAVGDGAEFPATTNSFTFCNGYLLNATTCLYGTNGTAYWVPASGIGSFTYWSYGEGTKGTFQGEVGGGFGQSYVEPQPWWQNALDTYSSGSAVMPQISGSAAFNMTIYVGGGWEFFYGGTSFATPIQAGEWALVEEQANAAFGHPMMGDINPLLYAAHNAFEAGANGVSVDPYTPMSNIGVGADWAPVNSYTWYLWNLSIEEPTAGTQPFWFPTLFNPAGSGWNYLQGLGIPDATLLENALLGQTGIAGNSLANPAFQVLEVTSGGLVPFTTLSGGSTYTMEVVDTSGHPGIYDVTAYSGGSDAGTYGGGTTTTLQTGPSGVFSYTPVFGNPPGGDGATTYGYFLITSVVGGSNAPWSFTDFAVGAPTPTGNLTLCVVDPYGSCDQGNTETTQFTTVQAGYYSLYGQSQVYLGGLPVSGAEVWQVSVQSQYGIEDPTLPPAYYAPGTTIGHTLSDARGTALFWTDADPLAEVNGTLLTQIYTLTATYDGLTSNTVTVFVEPQSGSFFTGDLALNSSGDVTGTVQFADMKYVNWINVSVGSAPGQFVNTSYPPAYYDSFGNIWESGVDNGAIPVTLSTEGLTGPVVVSVLAEGDNDLSFVEIFDGFVFSTRSVQNPMFWQDPTVFLPTHLSASASGTVTGTVDLTYAGIAYPGATATLSLVSGGTTTVLATGTSGTYALDTTRLPDGTYAVVYSEYALGAIGEIRTVTLYASNEIAALSATVASLSTRLSSLQATVASLQSGWAASNATLSQLATTLSGDQATIASLQAQLGQLKSTDQAQIAALQAQLSSESTQVSALQAQVAQLQQELAQKHTAAAPPWYEMGGLAGVLAWIGVAALVAVLTGFVIGRRGIGRKGVENPRRPEEEGSSSGRISTRPTDSEALSNWPVLRVPPLQESTLRDGASAPSGPPGGSRPSTPSGEWMGPPN